MDKKILTIQDISCYGQCSLTVALPIISACGVETAILPSAVLSTHTAGFKDFTVRDLSGDMPDIRAHWEKEGIKYDAVYTGYLGSQEQIQYVLDIKNTCLKEEGIFIVDPAMGDNGKLYPAFDMEYALGMAKLCDNADIILPNITEACFMTGMEYKEFPYTEEYILELIKKLAELGTKKIILTGVGFKADELGVAVYEGDINNVKYYFNEKVAKSSHGTGDVYASAFTGAYAKGMNIYDAAALAADFTVESILKTMDDESHWYGVKFEKALPMLVEKLNK